MERMNVSPLPNGDALMDPAECLEDHQTRILHKLVQPLDDEEIVDDHRLAFVQLGARTLKVKVDVETLEELGNGIPVGVRLLLDDLDQILERVATPRIDDDGRRQVTQNMRTHRLNGVQIERTIEEHLNDVVASLRVVHEHEHTPVDQPGALLQRLGAVEVAVVDELAQAIQILMRRRPVERQDLGGQDAPQQIQVVGIVGLHDQQAKVQMRNGLLVATALVQVFAHFVGTVHPLVLELQEYVFKY